MHQPSSIKSSSQWQKQKSLAEWMPASGTLGILLGILCVCIVFFKPSSILCQTEEFQPCPPALIEALQRLSSARLLFVDHQWQTELEKYGYSPQPVKLSRAFPHSVVLIVREQAPVYQLTMPNVTVSVNSDGYMFKSRQALQQLSRVQITDPDLANQISSAQNLPTTLHIQLLASLKQLNALSLSATSLQLRPDNALVIELAPTLLGIVSITDTSSIDRLQFVLASNQLTFEEGQAYELDTRFTHPVLRKRL